MSSGDSFRHRGATQRKIDLLDLIDYRLAETDAEKDEIYRLRYRAYLNEGTIDPNAAQRITDRFDDLGNSWIFGVYFDGVLASSVRITVASPEFPVSPSMDVFADVLQPEIAKGKVIVDPTRFVAEPDGGKRFAELPYMTLRLAYMACGYFNADIGLATVRAEHQAFYSRVFMHRPIAPPRQYPGLTKPISLMAVDYPEMRDRVFARYPYLGSSYFERRMLFERRRGQSASVTQLSHVATARTSIVPST